MRALTMSPLAPLSALLTLLLWSSPPSSLCARTPEVTLVQGSLTGTTFRYRGQETFGAFPD